MELYIARYVFHSIISCGRDAVVVAARSHWRPIADTLSERGQTAEDEDWNNCEPYSRVDTGYHITKESHV